MALTAGKDTDELPERDNWFIVRWKFCLNQHSVGMDNEVLNVEQRKLPLSSKTMILVILEVKNNDIMKFTMGKRTNDFFVS